MSPQNLKKRLFNSYRGIRQICYNPNNWLHQSYAREGIILICDFDSFDEFYSWVIDKLGPPPTATARIVRKNMRKGYTRRNLEWADTQTQQRRQRKCRMITYQGRRQCLSRWIEELDLNKDTVYHRYSKGITDPKKLLYKGSLNAKI